MKTQKDVISSLEGRLELRCEEKEGKSFLEHQYFSVPYHISKTYWNESVLLVQVTNPTAGIFAGDRMTSSVMVGESASLLLTSPSAQRVYSMHKGDASQHIKYTVKKGGWLEVFPELFVPQKKSRYRQECEVEIEAGGEVYFAEIIAPGRLTHGENMQFEQLDWNFKISYGGDLLSLERCYLNPLENPWMLKVPNWEQTYYFSIWVLSDKLSEIKEQFYQKLDQLGGKELYLGFSSYDHRAIMIKGMSLCILRLRKVMLEIRQLFSGLLHNLSVTVRKL
ncbi:MAG: urease accessory protein UreD [Verrucomicrobiota bacterium]